jgi:lysyl-tRNA synthetase, class I
MARGGQGEPTDWVTRAADDAIRHAGEGNPVTVSSGISPSGPVHLGNLREILTVHFVADELHRRGTPARHLHVWDDFDRFRRVPAGVDPEWSDHIGRPLSGVPDPWECHDSWADHFKEPLRTALADLGVEMEEVSQTERYRAGVYRTPVRTAIERRDEIEAILARQRTKKEAESVESDAEEEPPPGASGDLDRFPFKPYCGTCGRDTLDLTDFTDPVISYTCRVCGYHGRFDIDTDTDGKLVWKVDWPMRWAFEHVDFEPAGMDHATPGSSFTVGHEVVERIFEMPRPAWFGYAFVGFAGVQKMSSSAGGAPTAADALRILEAPILRWLYVRRQPRQAFNIDFGPEVVRLYDEWDALGRKARTKRDVTVLAFERAAATSTAGSLSVPRVVVPFRTLASVADVTAGSAELISRVIGRVGHEHSSVDDLEPRLSRAIHWTSEFVPDSERTIVRESPDTERLATLSSQEATWLRLLLEELPDGELDVDPVTKLVYGVPKLARGQELDADPTDEVKADQKEFFRLLYNLLVGKDRGPRLPTLIVALGQEKVRSLLTIVD